MLSALIIGAPASGSGKTSITLALLRYLKRQGLTISSCKVGPDYIDPAFHAAASGRPCLNVDAWAMRPSTIHGALSQSCRGAAMLIVEGVMGLFDGARVGPGAADTGSTADFAARFGLPVVLVMDVEGQGASAAATLEGFARHRDDVRIAGVILNKIGGAGHARLLKEAIAERMPDIPVVAAVPRHADFELPARHLGLIQASEHQDLERFLDRAAERFAEFVSLDALLGIAQPIETHHLTAPAPLAPIGQSIAVASDSAFSFSYPLTLTGWRAAGADVSVFSPLANEAPPPSADAVFLPGGYPELHAGRLAANERFLLGLRAAAARGASVVGECGGYMVLGRWLTDAKGTRHAMAGLLPVETSFEKPRLHLGYRQLRLASPGPLGPAGQGFRGHEFHYATTVSEESSGTLFETRDARGVALPPAGLARGRVVGSFIHLIDRADS